MDELIKQVKIMNTHLASIALSLDRIDHINDNLSELRGAIESVSEAIESIE